MAEGIRIKGLDEFRKELRGLTDKGPLGMLKDANYKVASFVVSSAAPRMAGRSSRAAASMRASKAAQAARITAGGAKVPWFGGVEFGSGRNVPRKTARGSRLGWNQFSPWRGNGPGAGYYLYPTIRAEIDTIVEMYGDELDRVARSTFPD